MTNVESAAHVAHSVVVPLEGASGSITSNTDAFCDKNLTPVVLTSG